MGVIASSEQDLSEHDVSQSAPRVLHETFKNEPSESHRQPRSLG